MTWLLTRLFALFALVVLIEASVADRALAHTGEEAGNMHVLVEFGLWGLGLAGALAIFVLVFWVRARLRERSQA